MTDKKLLYKHIRMLQMFSVVYRSFVNSPNSLIYEITKLAKDSSGNVIKSIDFVLSGYTLDCRKPINDLGIFDVYIRMLDKSYINSYVSQCKSYGIL